MARSGQEVVLRDGFEGSLGNPRRLGRRKMNETLPPALEVYRLMK